MKFDLENILKTLGWPLGLIAVFSSVLLLFGVQLDLVLRIAYSMVGAQALIALVIDVLKYVGAISDGNAGKWSAALNLLGLAGIAVGLGLNPAFDFPKLDGSLVIIAQFGSLVFAYIVQIASTRHVHNFYTRGLGIWLFSHTMRARALYA
jgi:hypothetical protein